VAAGAVSHRRVNAAGRHRGTDATHNFLQDLIGRDTVRFGLITIRCLSTGPIAAFTSSGIT
jgi:hypothetical protein